MQFDKRKALATITFGLGLCLTAGAALAQAYPNKPVRVIIPFPPGGTLDTVGRLLAQKLGEQTGQSFVVENRPGGNGTIGATAVAKAPNDGYTLLFNASTFTTSTHFLKSPPYVIATDFQPIALVAKAPLSVSINKELPITDVKTLLSYAKANPGKLTFAVGSLASAGHLSTEMLKRAGGIEYQVVPYKGSSPAYQDLIGGQIAGFVDPVLGATSFYKSGMLKIVAVTSKTRLPTLPEVPTVGETIPGYEFYSWYGLWGPAKLPADVTQKLNAEVNKALAGEMKEKLQSQGILLGGGTVDEFTRFQTEDTARSMKTIADANIRGE
jgi:tripartite-type tricarboxylate transporter receptor subunit TctC